MPTSAALELPRTFEEFNEQRRQSFLKVKDFKQAGGRLVGYLCSYTPLEVIDAAAASGVGLCGTSDEVIPAAEEVLPANLCPLIKSTYGFAYSQKCPFTHFSDLIVGETTCDGKKKMYELLNELKPTYVLHLPQGQNVHVCDAVICHKCRRAFLDRNGHPLALGPYVPRADIKYFDLPAKSLQSQAKT